jgi:hypothetical protein
MSEKKTKGWIQKLIHTASRATPSFLSPGQMYISHIHIRGSGNPKVAD